MKLTFVFAALASALFGYILSKQINNTVRLHGAAKWITLGLTAIAGTIFCVCNSVQTTDDVLSSTVICFGTFVGIGFVIATPRRLLNWHSDIFKLGIAPQYCVVINIFIVAVWLFFFIGEVLSSGCVNVTDVCIATLLTVILLSLLSIVVCIIALVICITQMIIWFLRKIFEWSARK